MPPRRRSYAESIFILLCLVALVLMLGLAMLGVNGIFLLASLLLPLTNAVIFL